LFILACRFEASGMTIAPYKDPQYAVEEWLWIGAHRPPAFESKLDCVAAAATIAGLCVVASSLNHEPAHCLAAAAAPANFS
jgi:hypothetical protein